MLFFWGQSTHSFLSVLFTFLIPPYHPFQLNPQTTIEPYFPSCPPLISTVTTTISLIVSTPPDTSYTTKAPQSPPLIDNHRPKPLGSSLHLKAPHQSLNLQPIIQQNGTTKMTALIRPPRKKLLGPRPMPGKPSPYWSALPLFMRPRCPRLPDADKCAVAASMK
ncbi:hypothetical protein DFP73DRAFT_178616 [Morchella snyderi]|nr:hypothetical protein DFP73DRAFT_178616 [Morchella snyderi]